MVKIKKKKKDENICPLHMADQDSLVTLSANPKLDEQGVCLTRRD